MLNEFLFIKVEEKDIGNIWFEQEGATCHTVKLHSMFWFDLTPLDYYFWGAVKNNCYTDKPETIDALNYNIREATGER